MSRPRRFARPPTSTEPELPGTRAQGAVDAVDTLMPASRRPTRRARAKRAPEPDLFEAPPQEPRP
jgi:hypothetical protein